MPASKKQNFLQGALILSAATALVKIIGALFKIPLQNLIGPVGMAHFSVAYNIYTTLFVISTAGLPVAVSKMISEANARRQVGEMKSIFNIALTCFIIIGAAGSCFLFFGARTAAGWMNNPNAYRAILAISPAVLFVAVMSAFRGYYQGQGNMYPTAISQVIEALCKLFIGYALASWIFSSFVDKPHFITEWANQFAGRLDARTGEIIRTLSDRLIKSMASEPAAAGAIGGISIGAVVGVLYLLLTYRRKMEPTPRGATLTTRSRRDIFRELLRLSIPVTISASVLNLTNLIDAGLVLGRLQSSAGFSYEQSKFIFGSYTFAQTLFNLPSAFILTLSVSIIPALSVALAKHDHLGANRTIESSLRITSLLAMPAAAGLSTLSYPILNLLNGARQPEAVALAAPLLTTLGFAVTFVCLVSLSNAILQSMGLVNIPIVTMLVGGVLKIIVNYVLVGNPDVNIAGAPIGTLVCYATIAVLNLIVIARVRHTSKFAVAFVKPLIASVAMGIVANAVYNVLSQTAHINPRISVILAIGAAGVFYLVAIILLRALPKEDLLLIPKGEKLVKLLKM